MKTKLPETTYCAIEVCIAPIATTGQWQREFELIGHHLTAMLQSFDHPQQFLLKLNSLANKARTQLDRPAVSGANTI
jgi:hypothetical protein